MAAFGTAEYWRERANEAREYLKRTRDPFARSQLETIIATYDHLAERATEPDC